MKRSDYLWVLIFFLCSLKVSPVYAGGKGKIVGIQLFEVIKMTGRGNLNEPLLKAVIEVDGVEPVSFRNIKLTMERTTSLSDVTGIKIFATDSLTSFDSRIAGTYIQLGECKPEVGEWNCKLTGDLIPGKNNLWITCDIAGQATEGHRAGIKLLSVTTSEETYELGRRPLWVVVKYF